MALPHTTFNHPQAESLVSHLAGDMASEGIEAKTLTLKLKTTAFEVAGCLACQCLLVQLLDVLRESQSSISPTYGAYHVLLLLSEQI